MHNIDRLIVIEILPWIVPTDFMLRANDVQSFDFNFVWMAVRVWFPNSVNTFMADSNFLSNIFCT